MTGRIEIVIRTTKKDCRLLIHFHENTVNSHKADVCLPQARILKQEALACEDSVQNLCSSLYLLEQLNLLGSNGPECSFYHRGHFCLNFLHIFSTLIRQLGHANAESCKHLGSYCDAGPCFW